MSEAASQGGGYRPPSSFDGFEVVRPLGRGGMGAVWLGHDLFLDRPTALKFIGTPSPDPQARQRFLTEARALARLQHANVANVFRIGEVEGHPYIAYEFVGGANLLGVDRPLPWRRALDLAIGVGRGLAAAHRRGVIHRDVKPANIVLTESGEPKLIDFGLARLSAQAAPVSPAVVAPLAAISAGASAPTLSDGTLTEGQLIAGTPHYLAPELWEGLPASIRSDLYALGLVVYELLVGRLPFADVHGAALIAAVRAQDLPSVRDATPEIPPAFAEAILRATRRRPAERYQTVDELCDALEAVRALYRRIAPRGGW